MGRHNRDQVLTLRARNRQGPGRPALWPAPGGRRLCSERVHGFSAVRRTFSAATRVIRPSFPTSSHGACSLLPVERGEKACCRKLGQIMEQKQMRI